MPDAAENPNCKGFVNFSLKDVNYFSLVEEVLRENRYLPGFSSVSITVNGKTLDEKVKAPIAA